MGNNTDSRAKLPRFESGLYHLIASLNFGKILNLSVPQSPHL